MASFGDSILRLFKKVAKQSGRQEIAGHETQLDGSNEARLKQLSERATSAADVDYINVADSEFAEPQIPVRNGECLQGNFGAGGDSRDAIKKIKFDRKNTTYDGGSEAASSEAERAVSFQRVISHRRVSGVEVPAASALMHNNDEPLVEVEGQDDAGLFAGKLLGDQLKGNNASKWKMPKGDELAPGKCANPTEESFKQVASCPTTSPSTLTWLATQPSAEIRAAVASNHHVPQDTLRKLSVDSDTAVRLAVASNKRTADDILRQLTHDENKLVSSEAFSALALREKASAQSSGPAFNKFAPPKVNPVQTKVPIITSGTPTRSAMPAMPVSKPPLPAPIFSRSDSQSLPLPTEVTASTSQSPASLPAHSSPSHSSPTLSPTLSPAQPSSSLPRSPSPPSSTPEPASTSKTSSALPSSLLSIPTASSTANVSAQPPPAPESAAAIQPPAPPALPSKNSPANIPAMSPRMLTPRSLPKPSVTSPPPTGLPVNSGHTSRPLTPGPEVGAGAVAGQSQIADKKSVTPPEAVPEVKMEDVLSKQQQHNQAPVESSIDAKAIDATPLAPDGHNLLSNHKFKTTSNHLVASYTDLDAISLELDNRSPNTWLSLNSEGAIKAYKKQKDTVKDVKMNVSAHNHNGPKRPSPLVNITPNATASETKNFLKIIAGRISTPPGRLLELADHSSEEVRAAVAENANLPREAFLKLSKDSQSTVKLRLIDNANCPTEVLGTLQNDGDPYVAFEARNALKRVGKDLLREREQNQFRNHGHNVTPGGPT